MARPQKPADARADVRITVRLTASEAASLNAAAAAAGRSVSEHIRQVALTAPAYRRRRHASANQQALTQLVGALGKVGSNVNQLARLANLGGWPEAEALGRALDDLAQIRGDIAAALGKPPPPAAKAVATVQDAFVEAHGP